MPKKFWKFINTAPGTAELMLYGDISDTSWWGDEVTPKQFAEELTALGAVSELTVRINSGGGDVFAAQAIGNLLEQHTANVAAKIDGLCASAATIVACHCNKVVAANDATYMIHPVKMGMYGYLDEKQLQQYIEALAAIKENIISLYVKKTGRDKDEITGWMDATSWWTAQKAKDNGFVDELVDDETVTVEDRDGVLFVNSVRTGVMVSDAPDFIRNGVGRAENKSTQEEQSMDHQQQNIQTVDQLRAAYPDLVDQIERSAMETARNEERARIQDIEDMALPGSEEVTREAKFTKPVSAADYAKAAMKRAKEKGSTYLNEVEKDAEKSGANGVKNESTGKQAETDEFMDAIKAMGQKEEK